MCGKIVEEPKKKIGRIFAELTYP